MEISDINKIYIDQRCRINHSSYYIQGIMMLFRNKYSFEVGKHYVLATTEDEIAYAIEKSSKDYFDQYLAPDKVILRILSRL